MIRQFLAFLSMLILPILGFAQKSNTFTITGKLPVQISGYIFLGYPRLDHTWKIDSSLVKNGNFNFKGDLSNPVVAKLYNSKIWTQLILEPAVMNINIKNAEDLSNIEITGSKSQNELSELNRSLQKVEKRWKIVIDTLTAVNKRSNALFQEYKNWVLTPYFSELEELNNQFIHKYPNSLASALVLRVFARELSTDTLQAVYNRFPNAVKQSVEGKNIAQELMARKLGVPGTTAPIFSKEDIDGKLLSLMSLRGKYVLLDFWGSWCVPCRKGNPHLIDLYQKYKNSGFEIIGIAADDKTPDAWRKAVVDDKLPWLNVLDGGLSKKYNIVSYPTKIFIDKTGKIIGRFGEEQHELDAMLAKIFASVN